MACIWHCQHSFDGSHHVRISFSGSCLSPSFHGTTLTHTLSICHTCTHSHILFQSSSFSASFLVIFRPHTSFIIIPDLLSVCPTYGTSPHTHIHHLTVSQHTLCVHICCTHLGGITHITHQVTHSSHTHTSTPLACHTRAFHHAHCSTTHLSFGHTSFRYSHLMIQFDVYPHICPTHSHHPTSISYPGHFTNQAFSHHIIYGTHTSSSFPVCAYDGYCPTLGHISNSSH